MSETSEGTTGDVDLGKADQPDSLVNCQGATFRNFGSVWKECRIYGQRSALREGEIVWTIDDGVSASTADLARILGDAGIPATFFPIASSLVEACGTRRCTSDQGRARMSHIVQSKYDHTVSNHTFSHPTGLASMGDFETRVEVADAHFALRQVIADAGGDVNRKFYPAFRSPGNSWSADRAPLLNYNTLAGYRGPFAWDMPSFGEEDFRCWGQGDSIATCAQSYLDAFAEDERGILLIHSSAQSTEMASYLVSQFKTLSRAREQRGEPCIKFVPLACALDEDRASTACGEARACIHDN